MLVGRVGRAHGLQGAVVVEPLTDQPDRRFAPGSSLLLEDGAQLRVARFEETDRYPIITFEGIHDRSAAEALRETQLYVTLAERRILAEGEYWPDDLIGLRVEDASGTELGTVGDVEVGMGQDRLVIDTPSGALILPFVSDLVPTVDLDEGLLVVEVPPGLRE